MADLNKSTAAWAAFFSRFCRSYLALLRVAREGELRCTLSRIRVRNLIDYNANFDAVTLSGVDQGVNTDSRGRLFARVTGTGPYTVTLYKATGGGGGDAVASGSAAAGADATLTASNASGITGTITLASSVTAETDDLHVLETYLDWRPHAKNVFPSDGTTDKDSLARNEFEDLLDQLAVSFRAQKALIVEAFRRFMIRFGDQAGTQGYGAEFLLDGSSNLITDTPDNGGSGEVNRLVSGLLVSLRLAMEDESNGERDVLKLTVAGAAGVFSSGNTGAGAVASHTPSEHCPAGRHTFTCVDATVGSELFRHDFVPTDGAASKRFSYTGLQVGQSYKGPRGFGPITLTRTLSKTGDGSNLNLAAVSGFTISGESEENTDGGVLYWTIVSNASNWDISFYSSSNRASGDLVAKAENVATDGAFSASPKNGSGLTVNGTIGSGPTSTTQGTIDLQCFQTQNGDLVADTFYVDTTVAAGGGEIQTLFAEELRYYANSDTSGSESISDDLVKANTFPEFAADA